MKSFRISFHREGAISSPRVRHPTALVLAFKQLGISYSYYGPHAEWRLDNDPVDLKELATKHLDSRWGREAFLMMTRIGWSQGGCGEGPDQFREVIRHAEVFLRSYPRSEVSDDIRLELAKAYATWWNLSRTASDPSFNAESYKISADAAKEKAIKLCREYLDGQKVPPADVSNRLRVLEQDKGPKTYDYFCPDYED